MATSVTFGLIPLFTLPLIGKGMAYGSILFYRFLFASIALAAVMLVKKESFRVELRDLPVFVMLSFFYTYSSLFLLCGYGYMGAGVATTLHFTYPVFVTLLMFFLFREKSTWLTWVSIALAVCGVALLSLPSSGMTADVRGIVIVLLSAVAYGSYITGVNKSRVRSMNSRKLAFYHACAGRADDRRHSDLSPRCAGACDGRMHRGAGIRRGFHVEGRWRHPAGSCGRDSDNIDRHHTGHPGQGLQEDPSQTCMNPAVIR